MYYPDLTIYSYSNFPEKLKKRYDIAETAVFCNVGWLDISQEYRKEFVGDDFLRSFLPYVENHTNMFRGFHICQFCREQLESNGEDERIYERVEVDLGNKITALGCMEVYVFGENCIYICPDLIFHYMKDHSYMPPDVFREAVLSSVEPPSLQNSG